MRKGADNTMTKGKGTKKRQTMADKRLHRKLKYWATLTQQRNGVSSCASDG